MKRTHSGKNLKKTFLAVPAAALMLGVSQAQTTVGINFSGGAYASYVAQYGATSYAGFPVTGTAFGVPPAEWTTSTGSSVGVPYNYGATGSMTAGPAGALTVNWTSPDCWGSTIGLNFGVTNAAGQSVPPPGDDQVLWGYLDDGTANSVSVSGLAAVFPHGYVIQTMGANNDVIGIANTTVTDGTTLDSLSPLSIWNPIDGGGPPFTSKGTASISIPSGIYTSDSITVSGGQVGSGVRAPLCGFIISDEPVVSLPPTSATNNAGAPLLLSASAMGIPPLSYQWQFNGANISGATNSSYTNESAAVTDAGHYTVVVTNLYGSSTSSVATVTINQSAAILVDLSATLTNFTSMNATFSVAAGGLAPLTYEWYKNGALLANTNSSLYLTNLQASDTASYQVIITNLYGAATSSVSSLTVLPSAPPYEGFNYSAGELAGQSGGSGGWSGAWSQETGYNGGHSVITPETAWQANISELTSTGGVLQLAAYGSADYDDIRNLQTTLGGAGYGTIYISFVAQLTNTTWGGVELVNNGSATLFLGECWQGSDWGWGTRGAPDEKSTVPPSTYSLLVYRFDYTPTNTLVRLYVNPSSLSAEPTNATVSGTESGVIFDQIRLVSHGFLSTGTGPDGLLDELRIGGTWSSVAPYTAITSPPFSVQITAGGIIQDTKPAGTLHDGLNNKTAWLASSTDFNSVTRTGVEQFVETNNSQITIPPSTDFDSTNGTICFWVNYGFPLSGLPGPGSEAAMLFDCRTTNGAIIALNTAGYVEYQNLYPSNTVSYNNTIIGGDAIGDGNWHHVAITYDQSSNGVVQIYVDGVADTQGINPGAWSWPTNEELELGRSHDPYWKIYDGQMDDFRIYNRILTASEISTIGTEATGDTLIDTNALKVRFDFTGDSALFGNSVVWPYGTLISSPVLGAGAVWTPVTGYSTEPITSPLPILPTAPAMFYRLTGTP